MKKKFFLLLIVTVFTISAKQDVFQILHDVPTYLELQDVGSIKNYNVQVKPSGVFWNEILGALNCENKQEITLTEYFKSPNKTTLNVGGCGAISNLIPGIMDPISLFHLVLKEIESYRNPQTLLNIRDNSKTELTIQDNMYNIYVAPLRGRNYIIKKYSDTGTETVIKTLIWLKAQVNTENNLIKTLEIKKETNIKTISVGLNKTSVDSVKYEFSYFKWKNNFYPNELKLWKNNKLQLLLSAKYKEQENLLLPSKKTFKYARNNTFETGYLEYGKYNINETSTVSSVKNSNSNTAKKLQKANAISLKIQDALMNGRIMEAKRRIKILLEQYPNTPQAQQAKSFWQGLP